MQFFTQDKNDDISKSHTLLIQKIISTCEGRQLRESLIYMIHLRAHPKSDAESHFVYQLTNMLSRLIMGSDNISFMIIKQYFVNQHNILNDQEIKILNRFEYLISDLKNLN